MTTPYPTRILPTAPPAAAPKVHGRDWDKRIHDQLQYLQGWAATAGTVTINAELLECIANEMDLLRERLRQAEHENHTLRTREKRRKERDAKA